MWFYFAGADGDVVTSNKTLNISVAKHTWYRWPHLSRHQLKGAHNIKFNKIYTAMSPQGKKWGLFMDIVQWNEITFKMQ